MNLRFSMLAAAAATIALLGPAALPAAAQPGGSGIHSQADEVSSAKRKRYYHARTYRAPVYAAPRYYSRYSRGGDPSLGADGLPYRRPYDPGGCIIDEGYGRFTSCSNR